MSEWRGVLMHGGKYYTAERPRWSEDRDHAHVFDSRERAGEIAGELRERIRTKTGVDGRVVIVRRRPPSAKRREEHEAANAAADAKVKREAAVKQAERERVAIWLEAWLRVNQGLLAAPRFIAGDAHRKSFTQGMVAVLEQAVPRIREARFATTWDYRP